MEHVSDNDVVEIMFYTDAPCLSCPTRLELRNKNGKVLATLDGTFDRYPFRLPGAKLKELLAASPDGLYLYFSHKKADWWPWLDLGIIRMN